MKQTNKLNMIAAMAMSSIGVLFVISCSKEDLFGLDDYYMDGYSHNIETSNIKQSTIEIKQSSYDFNEYLDLDNYSLDKMTEEELDILYKAEGRLNFTIIDGKYIIKEKEASEINISPRLFNYIKKNYESTNRLIDILSKTKPEKIRKKTRNSEEWASTSNDCLAYAIAYKYNTSYESVNSWLYSQFGEYYINRGVPSNKVTYCVRHYCSSAYSHSSYPSGGLLNIHLLHDAVMVITTSDNTKTHAVNAIHYHEPSNSNNNHVVKFYYNAYNPALVDTASYIITSNQIPSYSLTGTKVIEDLIY